MEETNLESTSCSGYKSAPFCDNYLHHQNHHMLFHLLCSFEVFPQKIVTSVGIYSLLSTFIISCVGVDSIFGAEIDKKYGVHSKRTITSKAKASNKNQTTLSSVSMMYLKQMIRMILFDKSFAVFLNFQKHMLINFLTTNPFQKDTHIDL